MQTSTKVKSISGTSLLVATMAMLAAGGAAFAVITLPFLKNSKNIVANNTNNY